MADKNNSNLALISSGRWSSALFTSFTLSLSYFESHVLPRLRKSGCERVTVLCDIAGYRDSLTEQSARAVGSIYSVVPVQAGGGIFHPKICHLRAAQGEEDLLLVGSGNLTYPGHGGNIEVLEVLRPSLHRTAFLQAADFFAALVESRSVLMADTQAAADCANRLRTVAKGGQDVETVEFIHSLQTPGIAQIVKAAQRVPVPSWSELLVLSPYHHPEGRPVQRLLQDLAIGKLIIGIPTKAREHTAFPFPVARNWGLDAIRAVQPVGDDLSRRALHAKWFELRAPQGALTLTGSFNATWESFGTTNNVECGVLRWSDAPQQDLWREVAIPETICLQDFPARDDANLALCLLAAFDEASTIRGTVLGKTGARRAWQARLESAEAVLHEGQVTVEENGSFQWSCSFKVDEVPASGMQLTLTSGVACARGWVQVNRILNLPVYERSLLQALAQMNRGTSTFEDGSAVLDFVNYQAAYHLDLMAPPQPDGSLPSEGNPAVPEQPSAPDAGAGPRRKVSSELTQDTLRIPDHYDATLMLDGMSEDRGAWDLLSQVLAALLGCRSSRKAEAMGRGQRGAGPGRMGRYFGDDNSPAPDEDDDESSNDKPQPRQHAAVTTRRQQLEELAATIEAKLAAVTPARLRQLPPARQADMELGKAHLLMLWLSAEIHFRLHELDDVAQSQAFLKRWLALVCDVRLPPSRKTVMEPVVCGAAALCALWLSEATALPNALSSQPEHVHRLLDRYYQGDVPGAVLRRAQEWLQGEDGSKLAQGRASAALGALEKVLTEPTERQLLARIMACPAGQPQDEGLTMLQQRDVRQKFEPKVLTALAHALRGKARSQPTGGRPLAPRYHLVSPHSLSTCPGVNCYRNLLTAQNQAGERALDYELAWNLKLKGTAFCPSGACNALMLALEF